MSFSELASGGTATQSSEWQVGTQYPASLGIDGLTNPTGADNCFTTDNEDDPYWQVDLHHVARIFEIQVFNREDNPTIKNNLKNFSILIGEELDSLKACSSHRDMSGISSMHFSCTDGSMLGHYIRLQLHKKNHYLSGCEVKVHGFFLNPQQVRVSI